MDGRRGIVWGLQACFTQARLWIWQRRMAALQEMHPYESGEDVHPIKSLVPWLITLPLLRGHGRFGTHPTAHLRRDIRLITLAAPGGCCLEAAIDSLNPVAVRPNSKS